jgi:hypothetical protein
MNLLCPNCQKMLTVPEQYAGQLMKCPLCASTFTVPGLPPAPAAVPPPPETYPVKSEPVPSSTPAASPPTPSAPAISTPPPAPPPPSGPMTFSLWFKPEIVQWLAPAAMVLIVIFMLFFPWVGVYPGGQEAAWQYPFEIVFGWPLGKDDDLQKVFHFTTDQEVKDGNGKVKDNRPGIGLLMLVYLPLVFLTALVTVACAVLPTLKLKLPANVQPFLQWRWGVVAGLNLFAFLILSAQLLFGFSLESTVYDWKANEFADLEKKENKTTPEQKELLVMKGEAAATATKTIYPKLVFFLHLVAIGGAALALALERRGNKPPVRVDLVL